MPDGHVRDAHIMHRVRRATSTGRICSHSNQARQHDIQTVPVSKLACISWAEAPVKIARMTLTIKLDGNWSSFQLANNTSPLSVTDSIIAPSARMSPQLRLLEETSGCSGGAPFSASALLALEASSIAGVPHTQGETDGFALH